MGLLLLCLKIFFVRIIDVSVGTVRTIITVKGKNLIASVVGFFEILIWFFVARDALTSDINSMWIGISYSLGFAAGTYIGGILSNKFIKTTFSFEVITKKYDLVEKLREKGYGVTVLDVRGKDDTNNKYMLLMEIDNTVLNELKQYIKRIDKQAFIIVTETKFVHNGYLKVK